MEKFEIFLLCLFVILVVLLLVAATKWMKHRSMCLNKDKHERVSDSSDEDYEINKLEKHEITQSYQDFRHPFILDRGITVIVRQGDITKEDVDVIVNAANGRLQHGGGVARAIAMKAGDGINQEGQQKLSLRKGHELKVSEVLHTAGYNLPAKHVIHAVGPIGGKDHPFSFLLKKTFLNCLEYAELKLEVSSIAIPLISSGIFGGSKDECAESLANAVIEFSGNEDFKLVNEIRLINIDKEATYAIDRFLSIELEKIKQK